MRSQIFTPALLLLLFLAFPLCVSHAVEIARVGDDVITSEQFTEDWRYLAPTPEAPERTLEGKKDLLDRMIAKRLLSHYFSSRSWDTLAVWDQVLQEYERSLYLQALYRDALPEAREPWKSDMNTLVRLGKAFVDSLYAAYAVDIEKKTVSFVAEKSIGLLKTAPVDRHGRPVVKWSELFTDEEKKLPVAAFTGGHLTLGEFVTEVDNLPAFARPTPGNADEIALNMSHFSRERVFKLEFDKRNLRQAPWFVERMRNKKEELIATEMFTQMGDTAAVFQDEVKKYYEDNRDGFVTQTVIKVATITVDSQSVAEQAAKRITGGESFESVAVDLSIYTSSPTGFDTTDFVDRSQLPAVYDAIWEKKIGEVVGPVYDSNSETWKIAKLLGREDPRLLTLEEATPMVVERFKLLKADKAVEKLIAELRSKTDVEIDDKALEELELP